MLASSKLNPFCRKGGDLIAVLTGKMLLGDQLNGQAPGLWYVTATSVNFEKSKNRTSKGSYVSLRGTLMV